MANSFTGLKITDDEWNRVKVAGVSVRPNAKSAYGSGLDAEGTKAIFDKGPELIKSRFNKLAEYVEEVEGAREAAENERKNAENNRSNAESARTEAESVRQANEEERISNESARVEKDAERDGKIATVEALAEEFKATVGEIDAALDGILEIQKNLKGIITFTYEYMDGYVANCAASYGMTWGEWVDSDYNTSDFAVDETGLVKDRDDKSVLIEEGLIQQKSSYVIINDEAYIYG